LICFVNVGYPISLVS